MADCGECAGKGQVVRPVHIWDDNQKKYVIVERAVTCPSCGGRGKV